MKHWQQYNDTERLQLLDITAARTGLPRLAVEKDWWVTMVLKALSMTQYSSLMSFKGGTSLSKGWQLIERFSEDIDIAKKREGRFAIAGTSNSQLAKARRTARHYIVRELPGELKAALSSMGVMTFTVEPETERIKDGVAYEMRADTHPSVVYVNYSSIVPETSEYLQSRVKIEISCLSMDEPVQQKTLRSFIYLYRNRKILWWISRLLSRQELFWKRYSCFMKSSWRRNQEVTECPGTCTIWNGLWICSLALRLCPIGNYIWR